MNTKFILRMDENLIAQAKAYAAKEGRSLSDLVGAYFARLSDGQNATKAKAFPLTAALQDSAAPRRSSFYGLLAGSAVDESDYYAHLEKKHK